MVSDLEKVIKTTSLVLSTADIKSYMQMILRGLAACHQRWVIHRREDGRPYEASSWMGLM